MREFFRSLADLAKRALAFFAVAAFTWVLGPVGVYDKWIAPGLPALIRPTVDGFVSDFGPAVLIALLVLGVLVGYHQLRQSEQKAQGALGTAEDRVRELERQIHPEPTIEIDAAHGRAVITGKHSLGTVRAVTEWATDSQTSTATASDVGAGLGTTSSSAPTAGSTPPQDPLPLSASPASPASETVEQ